MSAFGSIKDNALKYLLFPSILGSLGGMGYDYFDQRSDFEEDSTLKSLGRLGRGALTGLGAGSGLLVGKLGGSGSFGSLTRGGVGGAAGYYLYSPIADAISRLVNDAAVQEVEKRQNNYINDYMKTYGK